MGKKLKRYKVGLDSETMAISLVSEPAIEIDFIHMSKDEERKPIFLEKDEKYMVYGPVLIPDVDIYRNNGEQEYYLSFTKESIEKMSQEYMKDFKQYNVSLQHEEQVDEVCMVESWVVMDSYRDKANALGFSVPEGTWMAAFKVNNIDTWNRIKDGELKGFSVESMISLEEFSKNDNNMTIETNDMGFWNKMKEILEECFSSPKVEEPTEIEPTNIDLEEQTPAPEPKAEDAVVTPNVENNPIVENGDPAVVAPKAEDNPIIDGGDPKEILTPKAEEAPAPEPDNHLEELINSLKDEIAALKTSNGELSEKLKEMGKTPSAQPVNVNAKPSAGDTYDAWRQRMAQLIR